MTRSPQGTAFLAARQQLADEFALTVRGRKRMLQLLAKYDELLYLAYDRRSLGAALAAAQDILAKYEKAAPDLPPDDHLLLLSVAERTTVKTVIAAIEKLLNPEPEKKPDAAPADVPAGA